MNAPSARPLLAMGDLSGTNLTRASDHNQRVVLQAIRSNTATTRSELTNITGLTAPAVANITARLLSDGLIMKAGRVLGGRGQPATKFVIDPDGAFALGVNIDRDHVTMLAIDLAGDVRFRASLEAHFTLPEDVLSFVQTQLDKIREEKTFNTDRLVGIGIGIPDRLGHIPLLNKPPVYEVWSQIDVGRLFADAFSLPAYLENDATAAAIGELHFGCRGMHQHFIFTLISAGVGCGIIINGQPYRGGDTKSGEIAFISRGIFAEPGNDSILQDKVSLYSLYADLWATGFKVASPDDLMKDDPDLLAALDSWADRAASELLGTAAVINCVLDPEVHIIGGRLPRVVIARICDQMNALMGRVIPHAPSIAPFRAAAAEADAAPMGAGMLVFQNRLLHRPEALRKTFSDLAT
ncbi:MULTISPECIES: ROK family protein [Asticcacaulis]|uniref:ROK family protein n=1 Tax=Asticcacaulis TaxID=76890 RepID=UPI001AE2ADE4|nr:MULTISPECIES: ROK family protein [Asticcacaulis]MBP2160508.1 putative NBD/HSP70 family sugar kinase [Asticcacaulis solisilvae]MDR6801553.1 putative NBD/HSP70 family sugar kinase [Asticcacaulis sp. BE141]